jgi:acetylornithine deacetylase/succinyl-diaminopimelate desuccinylase-like protein
VARTTPELLDELFDFLRIPSISSGDGAPSALREAAEWVCARVRDAGGTAAVEETARNPIAIGQLHCGRRDARRILLYGHYDVQTVHPLEAWRWPPFEPRVDEGFIHARGASDDKGNFHCLLAATLDLAREGALACDVTIVADGEEEIGGDSIVVWLGQQPTGRYDAAVVFDGSMIAPGVPALTIGVRGVMTGQLRVRTGSRDVHSGVYGGAALNAAHVLASLIDATRARSGRLPPELEEGAVPPSPSEAASWAALPSGAAELAAAGIAPLDAGAVGEYYLRTFALPTFDVNAITCRDADHHRTIIPCEATAAVSMRIVPDQDPARIWSALENHFLRVAPAGAELELVSWAKSAGAAFDADAPMLRAARGVLSEVFGNECVVARTGGAIPLVSALSRAGVPTILTGVASADDNIHAPNERLSVASYELGVRAARRLIERLAERE